MRIYTSRYGEMPFFSSCTISAASSAPRASKSYLLLSVALYTTSYSEHVVLDQIHNFLLGRLQLTLTLVGCFLGTLHPMTLLKCTVVVLPVPSCTILPPDAGMM